MFSFKKTLPTPPPPPKSCKSDKTNVNKSQFLVHWGCNSATPLQQLRSVFCTCFANTDKHTTQSQGPCTASQVKTKRNEMKTNPKPQVDSHRSLPSLLRAMPWPQAGRFGRERNTRSAPSGLILPRHPSALSLRLSPRRRLLLAPPSCPPNSPPLHPPLPKCAPGVGAEENRPTGGGRLGKKQVPLPG